MKDTFLRSRIRGLYLEVKVHTNLPTKSDYKIHYVRGIPRLSTGVQGDWAYNSTTGTIYIKTIYRWENVLTALKFREVKKKIYKVSLDHPKIPRDNINTGWADRMIHQPVEFTNIWESFATFIGDVRISNWSKPRLIVQGTKVKKPLFPQKEKPRLNVAFIYKASLTRPPLDRRVDNPTIGTGWSFSRVIFGSKDMPVWQSWAYLDENGKLHGRWATPLRISGFHDRLHAMDSKNDHAAAIENDKGSIVQADTADGSPKWSKLVSGGPFHP